MERSMRRFMKVGIILHVSYPQLGGGKGPVPECLERICGDNYFEVARVVGTKDGQVRKEVVEMIHAVHMVSTYGGQSRTLSAELNINGLGGIRRAMAVDTLKEGIDEVCKMGCAGFSFLCSRYDEGRKGQIFEQLLKSAGQLCGYARERGNMSICCEVFDYDIGRRALIGPAALAAHYAGETREDCGNFGLLAGLSHIPMLHETIEESILPVKGYIVHTHMENMVVKSLNCEAYGDNHLRFGFPSSENDVEELARYLRTLMETGFLGEKERPIVSFEVEPRKDESPEVIIANVKRTLNLAWELV